MEKRVIEKFLNYTITELGTVYDSNNKRVRKFINACGYPAVILNGRICTVAYLVAKAFVNNDNKCICVGYKDNNPLNVQASNLYWYYEGEIKMEDNPVVVYNEDGEFINYFINCEEAAEYYDTSIPNIMHKAQFDYINYTSYIYLFFEDDYSKEELNKRINIRKIKRDEALEREIQRADKRAEKYKKNVFKPITKPVVEFDKEGKITAEYRGKYDMLKTLNISYPKMSRIMNVTGKYNGHYYLLRSDYERIDITAFITAVERLEQNTIRKKKTTIKISIEKKTERENKRKLREQKANEKMEQKQQRQRIREEKKKIREEKKKIREEQRMAKLIDNVVILIDREGNILNEYSSQREAVRNLNISNGSYAIATKQLINNNSILVYKKEYDKEEFDIKWKKYFNYSHGNNRAVICYDMMKDKSTEYNSLMEASEKLGIKYNTLYGNLIGRSSVVKGRYKLWYKD